MGLKVTFDISFSESLTKAIVGANAEAKKPIDLITANKVGREVIRAMLALIRDSISPITGRKFPPLLKTSRYHKIKLAKVGNQNPNLRLTGDFLGNLKHRTEDSTYGKATVIGYPDAAQEIKEKGHREGGVEGVNKQPKRPTIPLTEEKEQFTKDIRDIYIDIYRERILDVLRGKG